jgi:hypothetical protein
MERMALLAPQFVDVSSSVEGNGLMSLGHLECGRPGRNTELRDCQIRPGACRSRIVSASGMLLLPISSLYIIDLFGHVKGQDR